MVHIGNSVYNLNSFQGLLKTSSPVFKDNKFMINTEKGAMNESCQHLRKYRIIMVSAFNCPGYDTPVYALNYIFRTPDQDFCCFYPSIICVRMG